MEAFCFNPGLNRFVCAFCEGKGVSCRGQQPRFKTYYAQEGDVAEVVRFLLMRCKSCCAYYAVQERRMGDNWVFWGHGEATLFTTLEADSTSAVYLGATASEWTKRHARGVVLDKRFC